jgi:hypothetical protein
VRLIGETDDPNLVMVVLGDHAPASIVSGQVPRTTCP